MIKPTNRYYPFVHHCSSRPHLLPSINLFFPPPIINLPFLLHKLSKSLSSPFVTPHPLSTLSLLRPSMASAASRATFHLLPTTSSSTSSTRAALLQFAPATSSSSIRLRSAATQRLGFAAADPLFSLHVASKIRPFRGKASRGVVSMAKKSVGDLTTADLKGKKVFVRADLNVPLDENQNITDDTRIRAAVPTIQYLAEKGAKVILSSHLGRPKGVTPKYSLAPLVPRLSELLGIQVVKADDCIGPEVENLVASLPEGGVLLLENVRFYKEEEKNEPEFAKKLASLADLYVNDAFGTAHRAHASTEGVTKFLKPSVAGFLLQKELDYLVGAVSSPKRPFAAIVGGSKVSSKIGVIESLLEKCDILLLGGGMIFTFYKAQGLSVGSSLVEEDKLDLATSLLAKAKAKGVSLLLPTDVVIADKFAPDANSKIVPASAIPDGWMGLDIGPDSIKTFNDALDSTKTIIWNGPMGVFEFAKFAVGTESVAKKLAELSGKGVTTIIGGGDSVAAVEKVGVASVMSHISTGGGASLELLEGKELPGVLALDEAVPVAV
ncbi:phosphoglycerate kinase, chloroplastic [Momordica charantia]|uniref:Phosphoglycerate kinase n=1 Tax=Momordica charantia TaxID=3673 RepID=A0A6J1D7H1_MOMCH|nr:phosphoglycerate kinase, chloroplastic [Momordica charantia]